MIHLLITSITQNLSVYKSHYQPFLVSLCGLVLHRRVGAEGGCKRVSNSHNHGGQRKREDKTQKSCVVSINSFSDKQDELPTWQCFYTIS